MATQVLPTLNHWTITAGELLPDGTISLRANGEASVDLSEVLTYMPAEAVLWISTDAAADRYSTDLFAVLEILRTSDAGQSQEVHTLPIFQTHDAVGIHLNQYSFKGSNLGGATFYLRARSACTVSFALFFAMETAADARIDKLGNQIPRLLYDYNTSFYEVGQTETVIAMINAELLGNTDIQGHLQLSFTASDDCKVFIRIKDNYSTELYAPLTYDVLRGHSSIGIPHSFLKRTSGQHDLYVTINCSSGTLTIAPREVMFSIDSGYMASRLMDIDMTVLDLAIQQLPQERSPSRIWCVGNDPAGNIVVQSTTYASSSGARQWQAEYILPAGELAAIEFNGIFVRASGEQYYTLACEETPWVFWVHDGVLKGQCGTNMSTLIELDTDVTFVSAVRGFKSELYPDQDQGLIVAYIKNGQVWYRNYCRQTNDSYLWETARQITSLGDDNLTVTVHRLNDFRVGFVSSAPNGHTWLITGRTYVGASAPVEDAEAQISCGGCIAVGGLPFTIPEVALQTDVSEDWTILKISSNYPLVAPYDFENTFIISDSSSTWISVKYMEVVEGELYIYLTRAPYTGILYLIPKSDKLKAYVDNRGFYPVPIDSLRFDFGIRNKEEVLAAATMQTPAVPIALHRILNITSDTRPETAEATIKDPISNITMQQVTTIRQTILPESSAAQIEAPSSAIVMHFTKTDPV